MNDHQRIDQTLTGYVGDHLEPITDFDFDAVDAHLGFVADAPEDVRQQSAEVFAQLLQWIWTQAGIKGATIKLVALTAGLRPDLLRDKSYLELASEIGVTKQALSHQAMQFQAAFGVKLARSRSEDGRANMRAARLNQGGANRHFSKRKPVVAAVVGLDDPEHPDNQGALARQAHAEYEAMFNGEPDGQGED